MDEYRVPSLKTHVEILDYVKEKLLEQGERSEEESGNCRYRSKKGKCAAGWLMDDAHYKARVFEGSTIGHEDNYKAIELSLGWSPRRPFLAELQDIHDRMPVEEWGFCFEALRNSAVRYDKEVMS